MISQLTLNDDSHTFIILPAPLVDPERIEKVSYSILSGWPNNQRSVMYFIWKQM